MSNPQLVVGVAGHIDHGKSALVRALTGTDPDRLPEEQARGMTIDLGFAHIRAADADIWFVDVPGHERFIRNMVAGATGVGFALLVVAADDSIMPQTREHAEALKLLGIESCGIVVSKTDLVDADWAEAVEAEARDLADEIGLRVEFGAHVSSQTGVGISPLLDALANVTRRRAKNADRRRWFRMPIDRAFLAPGRGVVVTGSVLHGAVQAGDELDLWPTGRRVRARDLQTHREQRGDAAGSMRLAINIPGISVEDAPRGCELAVPAYLLTTQRCDAQLEWLRAPGKRLRRRMRLRLHIGTLDTLVEARLADPPDGREIRNAWAQLVPAEPIVAAWGQRFLLRDEAATRTLGGGVIVRPYAQAWTAKAPPDLASLEIIRAGKPRSRLENVIRLGGLRETREASLAAEAGLNAAEDARAQLAELVQRGGLVRLESGAAVMHVHVDTLERIATRLAARLEKWHSSHPRSIGPQLGEWTGWAPKRCPERLRGALTEHVLLDQRFVVTSGCVTLATRAGGVSDADADLLARVVERLDSAAFQPPSIDEVATSFGKQEKRVRELFDYGAASGALTRVSNDIWFSAQRWRDLCHRVSAALRQRGPLSMSEIKNELATSRKYAVPIVERLDALGVTRRVGDARTLGPAAPPSPQ